MDKWNVVCPYNGSLSRRKQEYSTDARSKTDAPGNVLRGRRQTQKVTWCIIPLREYVQRGLILTDRL